MSPWQNLIPRLFRRESSKNVPLDFEKSSDFEQMLRLWLAEKSVTVKRSTCAAYTAVAERHIIPELGRCRVCELDCKRISAFVAEKNENYSPATVRLIVSVLRSALCFAAAHGFGESITPPRPALCARDTRVLTREEQVRLEYYLNVDMDLDKLGVLLCLYTGLRLGELCALKWSGVAGGAVCVERTVQRIRNFSGKCTELCFDSPKSRMSRRQIPLPDFLSETLERFRCADDCFVLTGSSDRFVDPRTFQNRFKRILRLSDVGDINFHALRHTFATNCVALGFDAKVLSRILGHASVSLTLSTYVHPSLAAMRACMRRLQPMG